MCIATEQLKFLDVVYYIAPGKSYDSFISAYGATTKKSYFPYEFLDSFEKLEVDVFPPYEAFNSTLKGRNTLEPVSNDKNEALKIGSKIYDELKSMFKRNNWKIKDYLMFYNNLDTSPFVEALVNMFSYYQVRGIDLFKDAISGKH